MNENERDDNEKNEELENDDGLDASGGTDMSMDLEDINMDYLDKLRSELEGLSGESSMGNFTGSEEEISNIEALLSGLEGDEDVFDPTIEMDLEEELANDPVFAESLEMLNSISVDEFQNMGSEQVAAAMSGQVSVIDSIIKEQLEELSEIPESEIILSEDKLKKNVKMHGGENIKVDLSGLSKKERELPKVIMFMLRLPVKYMYAITGLLVVLLGITSVFGYNILFSEQVRRQQFEQGGGIMLSQPVGMVNNANRMFTDSAAMLVGGQPASLAYVLLDSRESIFGFNTEIDTRYNNFYIREDNGSQRIITLRNFSLGPTDTIRLQPVSEGVQEFTLVSINTNTRERSEQVFRMERAVAYPAVRHISDTIFLDNMLLASGESEEEEYDIREQTEVRIEHGEFSPTGTSITYSVMRNQDAHSPFYVSIANLEQSGLRLREGFNNLPRVGEPLAVSFNDGELLLANVELQPLRSLIQYVDLDVSGVGQKYVIDRRFHVPELFGSGNQVIQLGQYDVFIEGMAHSPRHGMFVLVFHTQDSTVELPYYPADLMEFLYENQDVFVSDNAAINAFFRRESIDPYFNRVETVMTAHLLIDTPLGQVQVPGRAMHDRRGSDVLFDLSYFPEVVSEAPASSATLVIEEVDILRAPIDHRLNMEQLSPLPNLFNESFFSDIEDQFKIRLAFKSGEIGMHEMGGFGPTVFEDLSDFLRFYTPVQGFDGVYNAEVLFGAVHNDRMFAVVREVWIPSFYEPIPHVLTHRVYAQRGTGSSWNVVRNDVLD